MRGQPDDTHGEVTSPNLFKYKSHKPRELFWNVVLPLFAVKYRTYVSWPHFFERLYAKMECKGLLLSAGLARSSVLTRRSAAVHKAKCYRCVVRPGDFFIPHLGLVSFHG